MILRDEYIDLATAQNKAYPMVIPSSSFMIEEFIAQEFEKGNISINQFTDAPNKIAIQGHCYQ